MIICRSPYRISFFGGGTDYSEWFEDNGGAFLSSAINQYCYSIINFRESLNNPQYRVIWKIIEQVKDLEKIEQPIVREAIKFIKPKPSYGEYIYLGDLPSRSGIGSSSAYAVSVLHSLLKSKNENPSKTLLANYAYHLENKILGENIGIQDSIASSFGGFNFVKIKKNGEYTINPLLLDNSEKTSFFGRLLLIFTNEQRSASSMAKKTIDAMEKKKKSFLIFQKMAEEAKDLISSNDFDSFGKMLKESWDLKSNLDKSMTTSKVNEIINTSKKYGALGYKLLGAGGGGFVMVFFKEGLKERFKKDFSRKLFLIDPFSDNEGTTIVENKNKFYY